jgi:hypothetical protein
MTYIPVFRVSSHFRPDPLYFRLAAWETVQ